MNIKGLLGNMVSSPIRGTQEAKKPERTIKSDESHDRDANGQQGYDQQKKQHGPMNEEQLKKAIDYLAALPSLKEHGWTVELVLEGKLRFVLVKDTSGKVLRRIPELDLWTLPFDKDVRTGQLLKKSA